MPLSAKVSCVLDIAGRVSSEGEKVRAGCVAGQPGGVRARTRALFVCVCVSFRILQQKILWRTMWRSVRLWGRLWTVKSVASLGVHTLGWQQHMLVLVDHHRGCLLGCQDPRGSAW